MRPIIFILFACFSVGALFAQEVILTGRMINTANMRGIAGAKVSVPGVSSAVTDDDGIFRMVLPEGTDQVVIEVPEGWVVTYPRGGKTFIPRSQDQVVEFEVERLRNENLLLRRELEKAKEAGKLRENQIDSLEQLLQDTIRQLRQEFETQAGWATDSLSILEARIHELSTSLQKDYIMRNREEVYQEVSSGLLVYVDKLKDLRDWLIHVDDAFISPAAAKQFSGVLERYNKARTALYDTHDANIQKVALYWERELLTYQLGEAYDLALDKIHNGIVLPLNDSVIEPMRKAALQQASRLSSQRKAKKSGKQAFNELQLPIQELEKKIEAVNEALREAS